MSKDNGNNIYREEDIKFKDYKLSTFNKCQSFYLFYKAKNVPVASIQGQREGTVS